MNGHGFPANQCIFPEVKMIAMKKMIVLLVSCVLISGLYAQNSDKEKIEWACLDYIEGFYEGDTTKIIRSIKPSLYKFGYWKNDKSGIYESDGQMTFQQAIDYTKRVF